MSAPTRPLFPTWRLLGLSVGTTYLGLGAVAGCSAPTAVRLFCGRLGPREAAAAAALMPALAARDVSIGLALLGFHAADMPKAQAMLILAGLVLCAVDVAMVGRAHGWVPGLAMGAGVAAWAGIGWGIWRQVG